jgi:hypothetical protein
VVCVERDQMVCALAPDRSDQALISLSFRRLPSGGSSYASFLAVNGGGCWDLR